MWYNVFNGNIFNKSQVPRRDVFMCVTIFIEALEKRALELAETKTKLWFRYVDDTLTTYGFVALVAPQ